MPLLEINDVSVSFGDTEVLSGITLELESKQLLAVLGASGAGKSTLMRLIAGFDSVGAGSIVLDGETLSDTSKTVAPEKRSIGIVPQDSALFPHLNVGQNIGFGLSALSKEAKAERVRELLRLIRMEEFASRMPQELSGGQVQRVALARALVSDPKVLLLDEPAGGIGAADMHELGRLIRSWVPERTVLLVEHHMELVMEVCDLIWVLDAGKVIAAGTPDEVRNDPAVLAAYLGEDEEESVH